MTTTEAKGTGPKRRRKPAQSEVVVQTGPEDRSDGSLDAKQVEALVHGRHHDPHSVLGRHEGIVRALRPGATEMYVVVTGPAPDRPTLERVPMRQVHPAGLWEGPLDPAAAGYRLEAVYGAPGSPAFV
ncbi:MAG TPA: hypothetical protein VMS00_00810, partial [Acidimicrobiales bacterium]|nr:hypothetical protein [Acidimicrobiales bacterium]